jgi:2-succinyl-6-hydroxy-2,4-cyclohexadiene-1-carboxylate synthase
LGHDGTAGEGHASTFEEEVDRLAQAVARQGIGRAHLAGYSLGARIALGLMLNYPELFYAATLFAPNPGLAGEPERTERRAADEAWQELLMRQPLEVFCERWESQPIFSSQKRLPPHVRLEARQRRLAQNPLGLVRALAVLGLGSMPFYGASLHALDLPVRLVAGELDPKFARSARSMSKLLRRGELVVVAGAGHDLLLERPEAVAQFLGSW